MKYRVLRSKEEIEYRKSGERVNAVEVGRYLCKEARLWRPIRGTILIGMEESEEMQLMEIARMVPEGSAMEKLTLNKIRTILLLMPEEEREALAQKAVSENLKMKEIIRIAQKRRIEILEEIDSMIRRRPKDE